MVVTRIATGKMMTEKGIIAIAVIVKMTHQTTKIKIGIEKGAGDTEMRKSTTRGQGTLTIITITIAATASASLFSRLNPTGKRVQGICIAMMDGFFLSRILRLCVEYFQWRHYRIYIYIKLTYTISMD
jgi:hypothetical protein